MKKRKILFTLKDFCMGGITTSFLNLLKCIDYEKYDVVVVVQKMEGLFINSVPKEIKIINYNINRSKIKIYSKIHNRIKLILFTTFIHNKFDFAGCFFPYDIHSSKIARAASNNNAIWIHTDLVEYCKNIHLSIEEFDNKYKIFDFNKIFFVSIKSMNDMKKLYPIYRKKFEYMHNIINFDEIIKKSNEEIMLASHKKPLFIYIGRFDEVEKRISLILEACQLLNVDQYELWLIGDGQDKEKYENIISNTKINAKILPSCQNPYPFFKEANCLILASRYEGYPVVLDESRVLRVPVLITDVSDANEIVNNNYGYIIEPTPLDIANKMQKIINGELNYNTKFFAEKSNEQTLNTLVKTIEGE